jgi:hypothetical protein
MATERSGLHRMIKRGWGKFYDASIYLPWALCPVIEPYRESPMHRTGFMPMRMKISRPPSRRLPIYAVDTTDGLSLAGLRISRFTA